MAMLNVVPPTPAAPSAASAAQRPRFVSLPVFGTSMVTFSLWILTVRVFIRDDFNGNRISNLVIFTDAVFELRNLILAHAPRGDYLENFSWDEVVKVSSYPFVPVILNSKPSLAPSEVLIILREPF